MCFNSVSSTVKPNCGNKPCTERTWLKRPDHTIKQSYIRCT